MACPRRPRVLQIHVTKRCNLQCLHCYSHSGPRETEALREADLLAVLPAAKELGYAIASLSGGEPFLYSPMARVLGRAKLAGLKTAAVTNGMFLDARRLERLVGVLDLCVISLDGKPERHNRMRAHPAAFSTMERKLKALAESGIPFGFLFTLSRDNVDELDWAAEFAHAAGASLLQVHPLDDWGRAAEREDVACLAPDWEVGLEAARRAMLIKRRYGDSLRISVDYQPTDGLDTALAPSGDSFAAKVGTLVIETDGTIVPAGHGFGRDYVLGRLGEAPLGALADRWERERSGAFQELLANTRAAASQPDAPPLTNLAKAYRRASLSPQVSAAA